MGPAANSIINHPDMVTTPTGTKEFPDNLPTPYTVPINSSVEIKLKWLAGFVVSRSHVTKLGLTMININESMLQNIQLLLTTLGVRSYLERCDPHTIPLSSGKETTISNYGLVVSWSELLKLKKLGFVTECSAPECSEPMTDDLVVTDIIDIGRLAPTYCFTEEKNNAGVFNGILTGQCLEIIEYTDDETIAVCNLHSLSLRMFGKGPIDRTNTDVDAAIRSSVDFEHLGYISRRVTENLNRVIDHNWYPLDKVENGSVKPKIINKSNKRHRPIGMGVSGFAELLHSLDLPFEDPIVRPLNKMIFGCMYFNALAQSIQLAIKDGAYESFPGSPFSQGKLQFDLWKEEFKILGPNNLRKEEDDEPIDPSLWGQKVIPLYSADGESIVDYIQPTWCDIKRCMMKYGTANSMLLALMPTASTAQVRRNCESVEAHQSNVYSRKVLKCSYPVLNRYLVSDLEALGCWNDAAVEYIRVKNGSILGFTKYVTGNSSMFPNFTGDSNRLTFLEKKYKTMWEIPQKLFMMLEAERGRYIDQSASSNRYIRDCTDEKLRACHLIANMLGLKTIMYYLRQTGGETIKFTADPSMIKHIKGLSVETAKDEKKEITLLPALPGTFSNVSSPDSTRKFTCTDEVCTSCT
jgi:ribonucleotide reductase alpha subunit